MRHPSEAGALLEMQKDRPLSAVRSASLHAGASNTKDNFSRAVLQTQGTFVANWLRRCSSRIHVHHRRNGPSVLRRLANRCAPMNHVALASARGNGHHGCHRSQFVALWHSFGTKSAARKVKYQGTRSAAPFAVTAMRVLTIMTPNPSFEATTSGLRPPVAPQLKR
jgi:hypothetical protein